MNNMKNAFYNALKTISTIIFPLITIPYISRVLSAENVGKINFSNSFVNYFMLLASLGVSTYAMRECSKVKDDKKELEKIASQIFSINVCSMVVSYIAFGIILFGATGLDNYKRIILILSINIFFSVLGADWLNMSVGDFKYIAIRTFLFQFISMLLLFMFVRSPSDYFNYAIILVISSSGGNIANIFYRRKICKVKTTSDMHINKHMKPILFLFSLLLAQTLLSNIDITILGIVSGDKAVGMYSMAVKIYTTIEKVISSIAFVLIPQVSIMFANQEYEKMSNLLTKTFGFICTFSLPMMIGLVMISKEVLAVVCGSEYAPASTSLSILSIAMFINLLGGSFFGNLILLPEGKDGQFMVACIIGAVVNLLTNILIIPCWGMTGAAATTLLSVLIIMGVCMWNFDKKLQIQFITKDIFSNLLGSIGIIFICLIVKKCISNEFCIVGYSVVISTWWYIFICLICKNNTVLYILEKCKKKEKRDAA
ncbi:flippase [Clostridiaceae bacterium AM27-36LB]|jgi:O-antigen/teichoic acid export membrane protein|nr:flippase [Clostridiaceae bacterium AM27-36LB]